MLSCMLCLSYGVVRVLSYYASACFRKCDTAQQYYVVVAVTASTCQVDAAMLMAAAHGTTCACMSLRLAWPVAKATKLVEDEREVANTLPLCRHFDATL